MRHPDGFSVILSLKSTPPYIITKEDNLTTMPKAHRKSTGEEEEMSLSAWIQPMKRQAKSIADPGRLMSK